jgi:hypothetical protein
LNLQQNDSSVIGSRLVFHFGGYDPVSPMKTYLRFVRELQRFRETWSVTSSASAPSVAADRAKWRIVSNGPNVLQLHQRLGGEEGQAPSGACSETKGLGLGTME